MEEKMSRLSIGQGWTVKVMCARKLECRHFGKRRKIKQEIEK